MEDGFLKAKDTTLGGDDGVAVAMALALLDSREIPHPPIEAVFTVDEELGMEGAEAIDLTVLKGKKLINLDSEEEKTLTVGCAGGVRYQGLIPVEKRRHPVMRSRLPSRDFLEDIPEQRFTNSVEMDIK